MIENKEDLLNKEYYLIETDSDGKRYVHIEEYLWDAHEAGRTIDIEGEECDADIVVTEYTNCYIPLEEFVNSDDRWELINDYEGVCQQYEMEYTWPCFEKKFSSSKAGSFIDAGTCYSAEHLDYKDVTMDTSDGWYWWSV